MTLLGLRGLFGQIVKMDTDSNAIVDFKMGILGCNQFRVFYVDFKAIFDIGVVIGFAGFC